MEEKGRKRQQNYFPHTICCRKLLTGLTASSSLAEQLDNSIRASISLYGAVEGKERVGKPLIPKAK